MGPLFFFAVLSSFVGPDPCGPFRARSGNLGVRRQFLTKLSTYTAKSSAFCSTTYVVSQKAPLFAAKAPLLLTILTNCSQKRSFCRYCVAIARGAVSGGGRGFGQGVALAPTNGEAIACGVATTSVRFRRGGERSEPPRRTLKENSLWGEVWRGGYPPSNTGVWGRSPQHL